MGVLGIPVILPAQRAFHVERDNGARAPRPRCVYSRPANNGGHRARDTIVYSNKTAPVERAPRCGLWSSLASERSDKNNPVDRWTDSSPDLDGASSRGVSRDIWIAFREKVESADRAKCLRADVGAGATENHTRTEFSPGIIRRRVQPQARRNQFMSRRDG